MLCGRDGEVAAPRKRKTKRGCGSGLSASVSVSVSDLTDSPRVCACGCVYVARVDGAGKRFFFLWLGKGSADRDWGKGTRVEMR